MNAGTLLGATGFSVGSGWQIQQVADFDGAGRADVLWRHSSTGGVVLWLMNGTTIAGSAWVYNSGPALSPAQVKDFNGDGKADILWYQSASGDYAVWLMDGAGILGGASLGSAAGYSP